MNEADKNLKREILQRAAAQAAWDMIGTIGFDIESIATTDEIAQWFQDELEKLT